MDDVPRNQLRDSSRAVALPYPSLRAAGHLEAESHAFQVSPADVRSGHKKSHFASAGLEHSNNPHCRSNDLCGTLGLTGHPAMRAKAGHGRVPTSCLSANTVRSGRDDRDAAGNKANMFPAAPSLRSML